MNRTLERRAGEQVEHGYKQDPQRTPFRAAHDVCTPEEEDAEVGCGLQRLPISRGGDGCSVRAKPDCLASVVCARRGRCFSWPHTLDDAFISFTYAQNLAAGQGMVFNPGERVEGFSNPLWVLLLATSRWAGLSIPGTAKAVGAAAAFLSVLFGARAAFAAALFVGTQERPSFSSAGAPRGRRTRRRRAKTLNANAPAAFEPERSRGVPVLAALLCAAAMVAHPGFAYYGVAGLETSLFSLLVLVGILLHLKQFVDRAASGSRWCYLPLGAAAITRPEGVIFLLLVSLHRAWLSKRPIECVQGESIVKRRRVIGQELRPAIIGWLLPTAYTAWRLIYFGELLPNTFYAKPGTLLQNPTGGLAYLWEFVSSYGLGIALISATCVAVASFRSPLKRVIRTLIFLIAVYTGFVFYAGGDWMAQGRLFQHILPLICLTVAVSLATTLIRFHRPVFLLLLALCVWRAQDVTTFWRDLDSNSAYDHAHSSKYNVEMAQWMADNLPAGTTIVTDEIGAIGYYSRLHVLDQWGLIDKTIAGILSRNGFNPYGSAIDSHMRSRTQAQIAREILGRDPDFVLIDYVGPWQGDGSYDPDWVHPITMRELHAEMSNEYELVRGFPLMRDPPKTFLLFRASGDRVASKRSVGSGWSDHSP